MNIKVDVIRVLTSLKYPRDVSLLLRQQIRIYESTVIFHTGQAGQNVQVYP